MSPSTTAKRSQDSQECPIVSQSGMNNSQNVQVEDITLVKDFKMLLGTYSGEMKNGKRHGQGVLQYSAQYEDVNGCVYRGNWVEDLQEGLGTLTVPSGNVFIGTFKNNVLNGTAQKVVARCDTGSHILMKRFDGEFHKLDRTKGVATFVNDWTFHCDYRNGLAHGKGVIKNSKGQVMYKSEWKNGVCAESWYNISHVVLYFFTHSMNPLGISIFLGYLFYFLVILSAGYLFFHWAVDVRQVTNSTYFAPGHLGHYTGQIHFFRRHGFGELVSPSLNYTGEWVNGQRHGAGVAILKGQGVYNGTWENDQRHSNGSMKWNDPESFYRGDVFVGEWRNDQLSHGVYRYYDGRVYSGDFVDGKRHGYGVLNDTYGGSYTGYFNKNWREGHGVVISVVIGLEHDGVETCEGEWRDDKREGNFSCSVHFANSPIGLAGIRKEYVSGILVAGNEHI